MPKITRIALPSAVAGAVIALVVSAAVARAPKPQSAKGGSISAVTAVSSAERTYVNVPAGKWANVPGANAKVTVPSGWHAALVIATLSADGICSGGECEVRVTVDGHVANPAANTDGFLIGQRNATFVRWMTVGHGAHTVQVQVGIATGTEGTVRLDDWSFTVERAKSG